MSEIVQNPLLRRSLNARYLRLTLKQCELYHARYARMFRSWPHRPSKGGVWKVRFAGKTILMPLRADMLWLDWDSAVAILGHDADIKDKYARLVSSAPKPDLFLDIGANYGTHSLLFAAHGIQVVSFEPNPGCLEFYETACRLNGLKPNWESVAVGACEGTLQLVFPERDTWLGSTDPERIALVQSWGPTRTLEVKVDTVDGYMRRHPDLSVKRRIVMKIDVEGSEIEVLTGGQETIRKSKPLIIFESNTAQTRPPIAKFMTEVGYEIRTLPWGDDRANDPLSYDQFMSSRKTNFIATPREGGQVPS
jgi:FkbM family methyltransferase